jgi:hypothetical protein
MTAAEYAKGLRELTYEFEHSQGVLISEVCITQNEEEYNVLDIAILMAN